MLEFNDKRLSPPNDQSPLMGRVCVPRLAIMTTNEDGSAAERVTTALFGEKVEMYSHNGEFARVRLVDDHYAGMAQLKGIAEPKSEPTHRLTAAMSYGFASANIKAAPRTTLFQNSLVTAFERIGDLVNCENVGWVPVGHLAPIDQFGDDPAKAALSFYAAPYLWGGNDTFGVDCSGLTQVVFKACGLQLPRDTDMQFSWCGDLIADWQASGALARNDLVFWKGHVGIMLDEATLMHANAFHMSAQYEPLVDAIARIAPRHGEPIGAKRIALDGSNSANWLGG